MTSAADRPTTALVVVDVQHDVVDGHYRRDEVVATISGLVDKAREMQVPVVWIQHVDEGMPAGSWEWEIVPELSVHDGEPVIQKIYGDAFEDTELHDILSERGIHTVVIVGGQTDQCIRSTLHGAFARGYNTTLVTDAHTGPDRTEGGGPTAAQVIALTNRYWASHGGVGRVARTVESSQVEF